MAVAMCSAKFLLHASHTYKWSFWNTRHHHVCGCFLHSNVITNFPGFAPLLAARYGELAGVQLEIVQNLDFQRFVAHPAFIFPPAAYREFNLSYVKDSNWMLVLMGTCGVTNAYLERRNLTYWILTCQLSSHNLKSVLHPTWLRALPLFEK